MTSRQREQLRRAIVTGTVDLTDEEADALAACWELHARDSQLEPPGEWTWWLLQAGRGFGKTRTGAEWARERGLEAPGRRIALVARTIGDVRDTMVEGETGLLACLQPWELRGGSVDRAWNRSLGELFLANGSQFKGFMSKEPARLRGPQHHYAWGDEVSHWEDAGRGDAMGTTFSNLKLGLRLGQNPRCCLTTTPQPNKLTKQILGLDGVVVTRGTTYENLPNLAPPYQQIVKDYEGTRVGRQELLAELLEDVPGALWSMELIANHYGAWPDGHGLTKVVVAVDPGDSIDEDDGLSQTGIVVAGFCHHDQRGYVLGDWTLSGTPAEWAQAVCNAYTVGEANLVVAEKNHGGEMVKHTIHSVNPSVPVKLVSASRGKATRAEPIAALYERERVSHVRPLPELEEEMTTWVPDSGMASPNRMDALVWAIWELMVQAPGGVKTLDTRRRFSEPVVRRGDLVLVGERYIDK